MVPLCPGWPPGLRPVGEEGVEEVGTEEVGTEEGGSEEGGREEFLEFWLRRVSRTRRRASNSAIRAWRARQPGHSTRGALIPRGSRGEAAAPAYLNGYLNPAFWSQMRFLSDEIETIAAGRDHLVSFNRFWGRISPDVPVYAIGLSWQMVNGIGNRSPLAGGLRQKRFAGTGSDNERPSS